MQRRRVTVEGKDKQSRVRCALHAVPCCAALAVLHRVLCWGCQAGPGCWLLACHALQPAAGTARWPGSCSWVHGQQHSSTPQATAEPGSLHELNARSCALQVVSADMVCWAAGSLPSSKAGPRPMQLPFPVNERGVTCTEPTLRVPRHANVFALGDISSTDGAALPPTAQVC